jgi:hypothetical protein
MCLSIEETIYNGKSTYVVPPMMGVRVRVTAGGWILLVMRSVVDVSPDVMVCAQTSIAVVVTVPDVN